MTYVEIVPDLPGAEGAQQRPLNTSISDTEAFVFRALIINRSIQTGIEPLIF